MGKIIPAVKGTRDFYPEDMALRNWIYANIKKVSESFGYQEYDGPFIEKIDLYAAKSGEELVKEQAFVFPDRGGELITLRPELTLSLARMVAQRQRQLNYPLRWWSFGPFWRYERPQKGRTREFFQWNADLIGVTSPESDAELLAICATFFREVGLKPDQAGIFVNDRRLMEAELRQLGIDSPDMRKQVFRLIDRREKLSPQEWVDYARGLGLTDHQTGGLKAILENQQLWKKSPQLTRFFEAVAAHGVDEYIHFHPEIIRGLDYYTGIVFEARDMDREGRAILGGGRYDNLVADVGGDPLPGVGFAMGDVMLAIVLEKYGLIPEFRPTPVEVLVTVFDESLLLHSQKIAARLRAEGFKVASFTEAWKLTRQLKHADKIGAGFVVIIGPDEVAAGQVTIKDLQRRQQATVVESQAGAAIRQMLAQA
jgi:histidyl-tRNA synthetase